MTTKLELYNEALLHLGARPLSSLTEAQETRRALDEVYDRSVRLCLSEGFWKFAQRTVKIPYSASVVPEFGYTRAHEKPEDYVTIYKICQDENLYTPLIAYIEDNTYWYTYIDDLYVTYISKHAAYGLDLSKWPETFAVYVSFYLASRVANRIKPTADIGNNGNDVFKRDMKMAKDAALNRDAMQGAPQFRPEGVLTRSRSGRGPGGGGNRRIRAGSGGLVG